MKRRVNYTPKPQLDCWIKAGALYRADTDKLRALIAERGIQEEEIRRKMGHGFHYLKEALDGQELNINAIQMIEYGISNTVSNYQPPDFG